MMNTGAVPQVEIQHPAAMIPMWAPLALSLLVGLL